jgi:hypothetical protein
MSKWSIAVTALTIGCASPGSVAEADLAQRDVDVPPRLLGCPGYVAPTPGSRTEVVTVSLLVGADGRVHDVRVEGLSDSPAAVDPRISTSAREQAAALAWDCSFQPATIAGMAVATRHSIRLSFPY